MLFADREDAGQQLARRLRAFRESDPVVLGLPRGGVIVAREVAEALSAELDVLVVRKITAPGQPEFAIGAVTARGNRVLHEGALRRIALPPGYLEDETAARQAEAVQREHVLRSQRAAVSLRGRQVLIVDDGIATGMTMMAAIADVRAAGAAQIIVATPVIARDRVTALMQAADDLFKIAAPASFEAVGNYYVDFRQTTDAEVSAALTMYARLA